MVSTVCLKIKSQRNQNLDFFSSNFLFIALGVALVKRILLFLLSIVFTIFLLIGATTSYAKDEFDTNTMEPNIRFYTIEWIDVSNEQNKKYVPILSAIPLIGYLFKTT